MSAKFTCARSYSDVAVLLGVTNLGPNKVSKGTKVYYYYKTSKSSPPVKGTYTLGEDIKPGGSFDINLGALATLGFSFKIAECGVSLKPF
jgi:hypothetical protein